MGVILYLKKHEFKHVFFSLVLALISYFITNSITVPVAVFIFGVFIDVDHLFDYFRYLFLSRKKNTSYLNHFYLNFSISDFLTGIHFKKTRKIYVLLHSFELVALMVVLGYYNNLLFWSGLSMFLHILIDQSSYKVSNYAYFLTYRIYNNFNDKYICKD